MAEVAFYHLSRPFESALPRLLERVLEQGHKVAIRSHDPARLKALDELLWTYDEGSFLPHGRDGDELATQQPILLTDSHTPANEATVLIVLEPPIPKFEGRLLYFFSNSDIDNSRTVWKSLDLRDDLQRTYWQQDGRGKWAKKA